MERTLVFEAFFSVFQGPTYFYYVEQEGDLFYFKFGPSRIGTKIFHYEDNRLSVIVQDKTKFDEFKDWMFKNAGGSSLSQSSREDYTYMNFINENVLLQQSLKPHNLINLKELVRPFFEEALALLMMAEDNYYLIDEFHINAQIYSIAHDALYTTPYQYLLPDVNEEDLQQLQIDFEYTFGKIMKMNQFEDLKLMREHFDLMREMLYIQKEKKYPQVMINVDGWTGKDLFDNSGLDLIDSYNYLRLLREDSKDGYYRMRALYQSAFPKSFQREPKELQNNIKEMTIEEFQEHMEKRKQQNQTPQPPMPSFDDFDEITSFEQMDEIMDNIANTSYQMFLSQYTVPMIRDRLLENIIGQDGVVDHVATYIYYHILRQLKPHLPPRPMLIAGPSGSGKTEVWRVAKQAFKPYFHVEIVDGSTITQEGWTGQKKLISYVQSLCAGAVLVVDEFDKLATPTHTKHGDNVSQRIQMEFLKLLEGEYVPESTIGAEGDFLIRFDTKTLGIVLVGAFETIRNKKERAGDGVAGFIQQPNQESEICVQITDEDLLKFGVIPELVGRIADKCTTNKLTIEQYVQIIKNKNSRVGLLIKELNDLGINTDGILNDEEITSLAAQSQSNALGVRWVSAQIEQKLIQLLANVDMRHLFAKQKEDPQESAESKA